MTEFFDTHAHLDFPDFAADLDDVLARARAAGVTRIVTVGLRGGGRDPSAAAALANAHDFIWATAGVHPHDALLGIDYGAPFDVEPTPAFLARWEPAVDDAVRSIGDLASDPRVVAIGEAGLDYHYRHAPRAVQKTMLARMVDLANRTGKPLVVHDREAHDDAFDIIEAGLAPGLGGTFHCFSGDAAFARRVVGSGFHISVPGVVTFRNAKTLEEAIRAVPIERILLETDCPYLAPVPHRGKRNEPAFLVEAAGRVAAIKGLSLDDVGRITTRNAMRLFRLDEAHGDVIVYPIRDSLYLNVTNRCTNACTFCAKRKDYTVKGHHLLLAAEPSTAEVLALLIPRVGEYREVVFCGFGEPTLRLDLLGEVAAEVKRRGVPVRVNTDGLANLVHGRDVAAELHGLIDVWSVSLNAADAETYARICPSKFGAAAYDAVKGFIRAARPHAKVTATAVALPSLDLGAVRRVAEDDLGVEFRVRDYDEVG